MAQVANFTTTSQNKPSIFEVIAQNSLNDTLHPALQRLALFLANNFPNKFLWLSDYYDEAFLSANLLLQYYYLRKHDASFSEHFYGLKRVIVASNRALSEKERLFSLLTIVVLPYFKRKLEEKIVLYKLQNAEGSLRDNSFKKILIHLHSVSHLTWGVWTVINYLRYMANKTDAQSPVLQLIGLKFLYINELEEAANFWSFSGFVKNAMGAAAFFVQFLQVWNAERPNFNLTAFPVVKPPNLHEKTKEFSGKCPICLQYWKIPTVLPVSGYVFCFPCILRYLRENKKCPVTNLPAKSLDIIRLYDG